jgi:hypothetical protein
MLAETIERTAFRKIIWRLMPLLTIGYILNYLDRSNIGFAALQMNKELGLTSAQFGVGAGILSLGYCAFEIPSNLLLYRFGARVWIARIMITWGIVAAGCALIAGPASFYSIRFLLGLTEAGFFPGVAFLLSSWFPAEYRARMLAILLLGVPVSSVVGGPISGALLGLDQFGGLSGWQWMFIIEGLPSAVLGVVMLSLLAQGSPPPSGGFEGSPRPRTGAYSVRVHDGIVWRRNLVAADHQGALPDQFGCWFRFSWSLRDRLRCHAAVGGYGRPQRQACWQPDPDLWSGDAGVAAIHHLRRVLAFVLLVNRCACGNNRGAGDLLDDSRAVPDRRRSSRRASIHQFSWYDWRICWPRRCRLVEGPDGIVFCWAGRDGRIFAAIRRSCGGIEVVRPQRVNITKT